MEKLSNTYKILSIDGGGIKGLYSATILKRLEQKYGPISDYFDLICGTSTSGIIALALAAGLPCKKIIEFYRNYGPKIFPYNSRLARFLAGVKQTIISSKYQDNVLKEALTHVFNELRINDSCCCLCIPAVNLVTMQGIVFKTGHVKELTRDGDLRMVDVALATTAAPTYFPLSKIQGISDFLVDGGLWANNPSLIGVIEGASYFVGDGRDYTDISLFSISNLSVSKGWSPNQGRKASLFNWRDNFLSTVMDTQSESIHNLLKIALREKYLPIKSYYRVKNPSVSIKQQVELGLDIAKESTLQLIENLGNAKADYLITNQKIASFFSEKTKKWTFPVSK